MPHSLVQDVKFIPFTLPTGVKCLVVLKVTYFGVRKMEVIVGDSVTLLQEGEEFLRVFNILAVFKQDVMPQ